MITWDQVQVNEISGAGSTSRGAARVATTTSGILSTSFASGQIIDGVTLTTNDIILIKNQGNEQNGLYIVQASGAPIRTNNLQDGVDASSINIWVDEGTVNEDTGWFCTNNTGSAIIGTHVLNFVKFDGDLKGPVSSVVGQVPTFSDTSGKNLTNSSITIVGTQVQSSTIKLGDVILSPLSQTSPNILQIPDLLLTQTLVTEDNVQTLTNKTLTQPIISSISNAGILTLPSSTDTLIGRATSDTLTNKTINANNNTITNVSAYSLKTATTDVSISGATAPLSGQVLEATSSTNAIWVDGVNNTLTTKGDILGFSTGVDRFPVGTDNFILIADSTQPFGFKWADPTSTSSGVVSTVILDVKSIGTNGGTFTSGSWITRDLNVLRDTEGGTTSTPSTGGLSIASNQISVPPGTYFIIGTTVAFRTNFHQCRLQNVTDNTTLEAGSSQYAKNSSNASTSPSTIYGIVTLVTTKTLELQHRCSNSRSNDGLGLASGFGDEVYSQIIFHKIKI